MPPFRDKEANRRLPNSVQVGGSHRLLLSPLTPSTQTGLGLKAQQRWLVLLPIEVGQGSPSSSVSALGGAGAPKWSIRNTVLAFLHP